MKKSRRCLTMLFLILFLTTSLFADSIQTANKVMAHTMANGGGWGAATPIIFATTAISQQLIRSQRAGNSFSMQQSLSFLGEKNFWCGLAADLAFTWLVCQLTPMLPIGLFLRTLLNTTAGFVGWEYGSGNIANADWLSIIIQASVATTVFMGAASLGPAMTTFLAISAAIFSAAMLRKAREDGENESRVRVATLDKVLERTEKTTGKGEAYLAFIEAAHQGSSDVASKLAQYQRLWAPVSTH